eukprot:1938562-Rhodomonas_salina.1
MIRWVSARIFIGAYASSVPHTAPLQSTALPIGPYTTALSPYSFFLPSCPRWYYERGHVTT